MSVMVESPGEVVPGATVVYLVTMSVMVTSCLGKTAAAAIWPARAARIAFCGCILIDGSRVFDR